MLPSTRSSLAPVTVTVCAVFQFAAVKVSVVVLSVPSVASSPLRVTVTSAVGALSSFTVNVLVAPASVVSKLVPLVVPVLAIVMPGEANVSEKAELAVPWFPAPSTTLAV